MTARSVLRTATSVGLWPHSEAQRHKCADVNYAIRIASTLKLINRSSELHLMQKPNGNREAQRHIQKPNGKCTANVAQSEAKCNCDIVIPMFSAWRPGRVRAAGPSPNNPWFSGAPKLNWVLLLFLLLLILWMPTLHHDFTSFLESCKDRDYNSQPINS